MQDPRYSHESQALCTKHVHEGANLRTFPVLRSLEVGSVWLSIVFAKLKRMSCPVEEPPPSGLNRAEHNRSGDDQLNVSASIWIADDAEPTANRKPRASRTAR